MKISIDSGVSKTDTFPIAKKTHSNHNLVVISYYCTIVNGCRFSLCEHFGSEGFILMLYSQIGEEMVLLH